MLAIRCCARFTSSDSISGRSRDIVCHLLSGKREVHRRIGKVYQLGLVWLQRVHRLWLHVDMLHGAERRHICDHSGSVRVSHRGAGHFEPCNWRCPSALEDIDRVKSPPFRLYYLQFNDNSAGMLSQDTLSSLFPVASLSKYYYRYCTTPDVHGTPVSTTVSTVVTIVFSNTVRAERSDRANRMTPIGVLDT